MRLYPHLAAALAALTLSACGPGGQAADPAAPAPAASDAETGAALSLSGGQVFIPIGGRDITAGFGTFTAGGQSVVITGAEAGFADAVELHTHEMSDDGRMAMRKVDSMTVPANGEHVLQRGGDHLMFFGVDAAALEAGTTVTVSVTAQLEDGRTDTFDVPLVVSEME